MPIIRHGYSDRRSQRRSEYDSPQHRKTRARLKPYVEAGLINCARCGQRINPREPWDLDHSDDRAMYLGASHARCNRAAGAGYRGGGVPSKNLSRVDSPPHGFARKTA
jgi:hypothetical protein